jgi:hypothetical protein
VVRLVDGKAVEVELGRYGWALVEVE